MGKGDRRTKRGKIFAGTYGNSRPKNKKKNKPAEKPQTEKSQS
jgi:30S ribosomal protein S31